MSMPASICMLSANQGSDAKLSQMTICTLCPGPTMGMNPTGTSERSKNPGSRNAATHQRVRLNLIQFKVRFPVRRRSARIQKRLNTVDSLGRSQISLGFESRSSFRRRPQGRRRDTCRKCLPSSLWASRYSLTAPTEYADDALAFT